jgi:hypothetical protein
MPCVSPPRAPPLPLPLPELTPSPAATIAAPIPRPHAAPSQAPVLSPSQAASASLSLSPFAKPFVPAGRSKAQRWSASSPNSVDGSSASPVISYRDALLKVATRERTPVAPSQPEAVQRASLWLRSVVRRSPPRQGPDADGWQVVECRQARHLVVQRVPRRRVPEDLRGKRFNCLSGSHRAAVCMRPIHCFRCQRPGHHAAHCPRRWAAVPPPRSSPVWRRISPVPTADELPQPQVVV